MKIEKIKNDILQYTFEPGEGVFFGVNVFAVMDGRKLLLIDTAYPDQGKIIKSAIEKEKLQLEKIIISHFHDDHMGGLEFLDCQEVIGHFKYQKSLDAWTPGHLHSLYRPSELINEAKEMEFGSHVMNLIPVRGHSENDLLVLIDDSLLHVGDLVLQDNLGRPILPAVQPSLLEDHINALEGLKEFLEYDFLLGHGPVIDDPAIRKREIEDRLKYLYQLLKNNTGISYEEASRNCNQEYLHSEWHEGFFD